MKTKPATNMVALSIGLLSHQQIRDSRRLFGEEFIKEYNKRISFKRLANEFLSKLNQEKKNEV